jgi:hypothetical protein
MGMAASSGSENPWIPRPPLEFLAWLKYLANQEKVWLNPTLDKQLHII